MEKQNIDWANLGFGYIRTDKRFVANYKNGAWEEGGLTEDANVVINAGTVSVKDLADGGLPSSLGAASSDAANLRIGKATLLINNTNAATNRGITEYLAQTLPPVGIVDGRNILFICL